MSRVLAVPPAPHGRDLDITIECTADPDKRFGTPHRVVIRPDWTVETPHDLDAERIARAFGGWSTCLQFAERVVPAFRRALHVMLEPGLLTSEAPWASPTSGNGGPEAPSSALDTPTLREAVRQEIKPDRILSTASSTLTASPRARGRERDLYSILFARGGRAWATTGDTRQIDGGESGFVELWSQGLFPVHVNEVARALPRRAWPLAPEFYARVCFGAVDLDWLIRVVQCFPERECADWAVAQGAAWSSTRVADVWRMAELGLSTRDAIGALERRVPIDALVDLAGRPGVGGPTAARWLTLWAQLGVTPTTAHYRLLEERRVLLKRPAEWMLDSTARALRRFGSTAPERTELAVMLALTPDPGAIEDALRRGIRTSTDPRFLELIRKENA